MTLFQRLCLALADLVLVVHAAFVAFVVLGLVLIWVTTDKQLNQANGSQLTPTNSYPPEHF
jgi:hypothetical protein